MQHEPCERITATEIRVEHIGSRLNHLQLEHDVMQTKVTEHTVHQQQQQEWLRDHTRLHRDWNMRLWLILVGALVGAAASVVGAFVG